MIRKLELILSTDKSKYLLGEPVIAYVQLINSGTEAVTVVDQIDPKYEHVNFYLKKENEEEVFFIPYSVVESAIHSSMLEPGSSISEAIKIFYGGNGWTFESVGNYQIRASYDVTIGNFVDKVDSNVLTINVIAATNDEENEQVKLMMGKQQGKFLLFEGGDHLTEGISSLQKLADKYPQSLLANYANFALGKSLAIDFADFRKGEVRKAEPDKSITLLNKTKYKELGSYFKRETSFILADLFQKNNRTDAAKKTLNEFIESSTQDPKLTSSVNRAKILLEELG